MSGKGQLKSYTSETAPRNGRVKGSKNKLSALSLQILCKLEEDWQKHGATVLKTLRIERPELYAKLALDVATRVTLAGSEIDDARPTLITVKWVDPKISPPPPLPPEQPSSEPPHHRGPMQMPRLLSFDRPLDQ
jgi:hypothetical protein